MKFFYIREKDEKGVPYRRGGMAVGYEPYNETLLISFARCSINDVWDKQKAQLICVGRLARGKFKEIPMPAKGTLYDTLIKEAQVYEQKVQEAYGTRGHVQP